MLLIVCRLKVIQRVKFSPVMAENNRELLGNKIREWRIGRQLSQEKLAALAGLHRTYVGAVERGERNISLDNIVALARALDVLPSELLEDIK